MDVLGRLLLRLFVVPLGYFAAALAGAAVIVIGDWQVGTLFAPAPPEEAMLGFIVGIAATVTLLVLLLSQMWLVAAPGILFSEAFAIRSWMFHIANGVVSAWIGAQILSPEAGLPGEASEPFYVVAAGLAAGLAYWLVAGSSAGIVRPARNPPP